MNNPSSLLKKKHFTADAAYKKTLARKKRRKTWLKQPP